IRRLAYRPAEAAAALGISERLLWTRTANGEIPCVKLGTTTLYPVKAIEDWLLKAVEGSDR
ncbi:MAG: helix-turn-helix domain-containing protein, partial [Planctomycetota bacterium JB042]